VSRRLAGVALATLIPFALLSALARLEPVADWELFLLSALALPDGLYGAGIRGLNTLGELWIWAPVVTLLALTALAMRQLAAGALIGLTLLADLAGFAIKLLVERLRPEGALVEHFLGGETFAFPSGHAIRVTALVAVLAWLLAPRQLRLPLALGLGGGAGALMGYARVALGVHWPSDVLAGVLFGMGWFALTAWWVSTREPAASPEHGGTPRTASRDPDSNV
jgi:membrane-associated phospholipid phosphatase